MIPNKKLSQGVTLIEILLVLLVGAAILILSIKQYQSFRNDADIQQLQYNVDTLFQGMADYYQVNCYGTTAPTTGIVTAGKLHPSQNPKNPTVIDITNDLAKNGFLINPIRPSGLVNSSGPPIGNPYNGYVIQFNQTTQSAVACVTANCATSAPIGTSVVWMMQVSVLMSDPTTTAQYKNMLTADCLSTVGAGGAILPCTAASTSGNYVVFERLPSMASPNAVSPLWVSKPGLKEFTGMYTNYPSVYLMDTQGAITAQPGNPQQYFLCGS